MSPPPTKRGTRKLSEVARHVVVPDGIVSTGFPSVRAKLLDLGIVFDDWQEGLGRLILGKRSNGKYAATVGGVVMSIPRQVGKTFTVGGVIVALCLLFPGLTVLWTAHRTRTSNETFASMKGMTSRSKVKPHMLPPRSANGEQEIRFRNGSRILFGAREAGFGRGFSEVDIEVFDEAQILTERALEDMVAATNQSRHPAGALLFYMGTPPRPIDPGEAFGNKRRKALSGESKDTAYVELSADEDAHPDDRKQWAKANPSYPKRTPLESMLRLRENVGSDESFLREGLGVWDKDDSGTVIDMDKWAACGDPESEIVGPVVFAVDTTLDQSHTAVSAAGRRADGKTHVEVIKYGKGRHWALDELLRLSEKWGGQVIIDGLSPAASLVPALKEAGLEPEVTNAPAMARACGHFFDLVEVGEIAHLDDSALTEPLRLATSRPLSGGWAWDRKSGEIAPIVSATLAAYGVLTMPEPDPDPQVHDWPDDDEMEAWEDD